MIWLQKVAEGMQSTINTFYNEPLTPLEQIKKHEAEERKHSAYLEERKRKAEREAAAKRPVGRPR